MNSFTLKLPATILAGDSISWRITDAAYPASQGWTLIYLLRNNDEEIDLTSTADGDTHVITQSASKTEAFTAGTYAYRAQYRNEDEGKAITVAQGSVTVAQSFGSVLDRGKAQEAYDKVVALLSGKGDSDVYEYEIRGRRLKRYTLDELLRLKKELWQDVQRENAANGLNNNDQFRGQVHVRFGHVR